MSWQAFIILAWGASNIEYLQRGGFRNRRSMCSGKQALYMVEDCTQVLISVMGGALNSGWT